MAIAEKPIKLTTLRTDSATLERLKVLAGNKPVARYLRELSLTLTSETPPSLDDLMGGESLTPIKKILESINHKINWLVYMAGANRDFIDAIDTALYVKVENYSPTRCEKCKYHYWYYDHLRCQHPDKGSCLAEEHGKPSDCPIPKVNKLPVVPLSSVLEGE